MLMLRIGSQELLVNQHFQKEKWHLIPKKSLLFAEKVHEITCSYFSQSQHPTLKDTPIRGQAAPHAPKVVL